MLINTTPLVIIREVSKEFDVDEPSLSGRGRPAKVALARQVAMYLIRMRTDLSLKQTGAVLGHRSPATVTYGFQVIAVLITRDDKLKRKVKRIGEALDNILLCGITYNL